MVVQFIIFMVIFLGFITVDGFIQLRIQTLCLGGSPVLFYLPSWLFFLQSFLLFFPEISGEGALDPPLLLHNVTVKSCCICGQCYIYSLDITFMVFSTFMGDTPAINTWKSKQHFVDATSPRGGGGGVLNKV